MRMCGQSLFLGKLLQFLLGTVSPHSSTEACLSSSPQGTGEGRRGHSTNTVAPWIGLAHFFRKGPQTFKLCGPRVSVSLCCTPQTAMGHTLKEWRGQCSRKCYRHWNYLWLFSSVILRLVGRAKIGRVQFEPPARGPSALLWIGYIRLGKECLGSRDLKNYSGPQHSSTPLHPSWPWGRAHKQSAVCLGGGARWNLLCFLFEQVSVCAHVHSASFSVVSRNSDNCLDFWSEYFLRCT